MLEFICQDSRGDTAVGIDAAYQALPEDCALLIRAVEDPAIGNVLCMAPYAFVQRGSLTGLPARDSALTALYEMVRDLMDRHAGIELRNYRNFSRSWDQLHYVLCEKRRHGDRYGSDLGSAAIKGAAPIADLRATQGFPVRWNAAATVQLLAEWLERIDAEELHSRLDPAAMARQGVYKFHASDDPAAIWHDLWTHFTEIRAFYRTVADHEEGILVVLD